MPSDFHAVRYLLPKFGSQDYALWMKTYANSLVAEKSDVAKFRLHVLDHCYRYGWRSACDAFRVGKSTLFEWKKRYEKSAKKIFSLVPCSTRPRTVRQMRVDSRLIELIKTLRQEYGALSKYKLKMFVDEYAQELGIPGLGYTAIGKIIKRRRFFFESRVKKKNRRLGQVKRLKRTPAQTAPGYIQADSITLWFGGKKHFFITFIDIVTRVSWCKKVPSLSSRNARSALIEFQARYQFKIHTVQTDNGSEFLGVFHQYLEQQGLTHNLIYPRSPQINAFIERFNRTIQEEFLTRSDELFDNSPDFNEKLIRYLKWYNERRPHASLNYLTPVAYLEKHFSGMYAT